jgi:DNA-binding winged helix-turn-helix (wHTH) protein
MSNIAEDNELNANDLWVDLAHKCLHYKGEKIFLRGVRFIRLMQCLVQNYPYCVNRANIMTAVWGTKAIDPTNVDKAITQLNPKLLPKGLQIENEPGLGYRIERIQAEVRPGIDPAFQTNTGHRANTRVLVKDSDTATSEVSGVTVQVKPDQVLDAELAEWTYFNYRDETVEALNTSDTSRALASRYAREPVVIGDQAFPVTILWQNRKSHIPPDDILGTLDYSQSEYLASSPTLGVTEYALARKFIKSIYTAGPVKHEGLEYCMTSIDLNGSLPRIDGRLGRYYDNILTQYAMEWELKKAMKDHGRLALDRNRVGMLPLREAIEFGTNPNPLFDGRQRCSAITVSMLMLFERRGQGLWTVIHQRSRTVGLSAGMLHVVPAGMFEAKNRNEKWSIRTAVMREMLEEVYNEEEQQGEEITGFEDDMVSKKPLQFLFPLIEKGLAELSITGICCDLLTLRPEICTVLFVPDVGMAEVQKVHVNWEYEQHGDPGNFGTPWDRIEEKLQNVKVGEIVPSGIACFELGRTWMRERHGI